MKLLLASLLFSLSICEYPYIFGNSINTKGIANGLGSTGITGSQTTSWGLDDVSQSIAYSNGTSESTSKTDGSSIWTSYRQGANTGADANNTGEGNALADSASKSFNPSKKYYNENYDDYIDFLNSLFKKYPDRRKEIIEIILNVSNDIKKDADPKKMPELDLDLDVNLNKIWHRYDDRHSDKYRFPMINGYPATLANFSDPDFQNIGQTTFDYQRARGSGLKTSASTNSGSYRWNDTTVQKGDAVGKASNGWATTDSNDYGFGRVNYVNSDANSVAYGNNAQANSESNYYLKNGAVWNDGQVSGKAEGKDSFAFSNINGNSYGYGKMDGDSNSYTNGNLSESKSVYNSTPIFPYTSH